MDNLKEVLKETDIIRNNTVSKNRKRVTFYQKNELQKNKINKINLSKKDLFLFKEFTDNNWQNIVNYLHFSKAVSIETAEDVTQTTFIKLFNNWKNYDSEKGKRLTWAINIAKNVLIDTWRAENSRLKNTSLDTQDRNENEYISTPAFEADYYLNKSEIKQFLNLGFGALKNKQKIVAQFYYIKQYKIREISELTGFPINTIKVTLMRANKIMFETLKQKKRLYI